MPAVAAGTPGAAALCSSPELAEAIASEVGSEEPSSLAVYSGVDAELAVVIATGEPQRLAAAMASADRGLHRVAVRHVLRHRRTWSIGTATPGITQLYLSQRRPGLSPDDYHRHWEREHAPRAVRHHMGMWDYTQVSAVETLRGFHVDGITVTQWPQPEDLSFRSTNGPDGRAVITEDSSRFTDIPSLQRHRLGERVVVEEPWPGSGQVAITDFRSVQLDASPDEAWAVVGRFDLINAWYPHPWVAIATSSAHLPGMTRTLTRDNGELLVERLVEYRPEERMLQLAIDEGLPPGIDDYTCRYEVRALADGRSRLDWYPKGRVDVSVLDTFGGIIDLGWSRISTGLTAWLAQ